MSLYLSITGTARVGLHKVVSNTHSGDIFINADTETLAICEAAIKAMENGGEK